MRLSWNKRETGLTKILSVLYNEFMVFSFIVR